MKKIISVLAAVSLILFSACENGNYDSGCPDSGYYPSDDAGGDKFTEYDENQFVDAGDQPLSTFSVDADGASYAIMRKYLTEEMTLPKAAVRIEEYLNYFTFDYPEPESGDKLSVSSEVTKAPWNEEHYMVRFGLKGETKDLNTLPAANYVFLVDVSGSMDSPSKIDLAKQGLMMLTDHLRADDMVSIVTYSGKVKKILDSTPGSNKNKIIRAINDLKAGGATAGGEAMLLAYETAMDAYIEGGNNRVIMVTDGDFNVGVSNTDSLVAMVEGYLESGIYLTVMGFGSGNLNDAMMEQIANHGNGNYEYIDNEMQMHKVFVAERNKFYVVAKDAKIQVEFNPKMVSQYRLIGYENRLMSAEDFNDEKKDAGEVGSGQTITAIYEVVPADSIVGTAELANLTLRYKDVNDASDEIVHSVSGDYATIDVATMTSNQSFASAVTMFGLMMRESAFKGTSSKSKILDLKVKSLMYDPFDYRAEFFEIVESRCL